MSDRLDIIGIGNAIVDVLSRVDEDFLIKHHLIKGAMTLIKVDQAVDLYEDMGPAIEVSGGSAANTIAGLAALGLATGFIGKVAQDQLGEVFAHDIISLGVEFNTLPSEDREHTARSFVLITPDAKRTMNTYLGASHALGPDDVEAGFVQRASIVYLEGYLWDPPGAKKAFLKAMKLAHAADNRVALTLSDSFCVERYRAEFRDLIKNQVDILFANEAEILSLTEAKSFAEAIGLIEAQAEYVVLTRGENGSVILNRGEQVAVPACPTEIEDTTGAGDLYAAGFLAGLAKDRTVAACGRMGAICAAEVISHLGGRPGTGLLGYLEERLGQAT